VWHVDSFALVSTVIDKSKDVGCYIRRLLYSVRCIKLWTPCTTPGWSSVDVACVIGSQRDSIRQTVVCGSHVGQLPVSIIHEGPLNHSSLFTNCAAERPRVKRSAGLSSVEQYRHCDLAKVCWFLWFCSTLVVCALKSGRYCTMSLWSGPSLIHHFRYMPLVNGSSHVIFIFHKSCNRAFVRINTDERMPSG